MKKNLYVCIVVDRSTSTSTIIADINEVLTQFISFLKNDPHPQAWNVILSVAQFPAFSEEDIYLVKNLDVRTEDTIELNIKTRGNTNPIKVLKTVAPNLVNDTIDCRTNRNIECDTPCLIYISDHQVNAGADTPDGLVAPEEQAALLKEYEELCVQLRIYQAGEELKLHVFALGDSDMSNAKKLTLNDDQIHQFGNAESEETMIEIFKKIYEISTSSLPQYEVIKELLGDRSGK